MAITRCANLRSVSLPETLESNGDLAFSRCAGLASLSIPASVTAIGAMAFDGYPDFTLTVMLGGFDHSYARQNDLTFITAVQTN